VWASYLGAHRPTTTTVEVSRLATHANCKIEISVIAIRPRTAKRKSTARRKTARRK
jgi:enamine deaminase RidA (YjgF/YER057c/UK114 family)